LDNPWVPIVEERNMGRKVVGQYSFPGSSFVYIGIQYTGRASTVKKATYTDAVKELSVFGSIILKTKSE
jgi:hypothetical protein